jgi:hypothetical protein
MAGVLGIWGLRRLLVWLLVLVGGLFVGLGWLIGVASATGACPNEGFRVGSSAGLADCRAYELVSPVEKNGGEVDGGLSFDYSLVGPGQASGDGEAVTYASTSAFAGVGSVSAVVASQYVSRRSAGGWSTQAIGPVQEIPEGKILTIANADPDSSLFQGFNESLSAGFLLAWNPQPVSSAPSGYFNPYLRDGVTGGYELLSGVVPPVQPPGQVDLATQGFGVMYAGMSSDARHVIFEANDALTSEAVPGRVNLYEWSAGRPLELVSVFPDGTVDESIAHYTEPSSGFSASLLKFGGQANSSDYPFDYQGAISADGTRAFWSSGADGANQVFMHELLGSGARTVEVSASQRSGEATGIDPAYFWAASSDGSLVYFTSSEQLTEDSTAGVGGGEDLYQYDTDTGVLTDLSVDGNAGETAAVQGVLGIGGSGASASVYFEAKGVLAAGASAGEDNLYVSRGGGPPVFVAALAGSAGEGSDDENAVMGRTSRVSPDGKLVVFQSARPLTGFDNRPAGGGQCPVPKTTEGEGYGKEGHSSYYEPTFEGRCLEVYEYNAESGTLVCVSCNRLGLAPAGDSLVPEAHHLLEPVRGWQSATVQQRYLLDDGRVFFESEDPLLTEATNGQQDVYEWEPEGVGQCAAGSGSEGCLYLISSGQASRPDYFVDASADGRDVFFLTAKQLVPQDGDEGIDIYDAREGGGFSAALPPPCDGEACKPPIVPAPAIYGAPSSATFQGAGDVQPVQPATTLKKKNTTKKHKTTKKPPKRARRRAGRVKAERAAAHRVGRPAHAARGRR